MNFEEKRKLLLETAREHEELIKCKQPEPKKAPQLRQENIAHYSARLNEPYCLGRDSRYNLLAYQQMTDKEILASEKREKRGDAIYDYLKRHQEDKKRARQTTLLARTSVA